MADGEGGRFGASCPRCDAPVDGEETACSECDLQFIDEEGGLSQEAVDAMLSQADVASPEELSPNRFRAPQSVRLLVALAITLPLAPVVTFVVVSVVPLSGFATALVGLAAWSIPAYALSGAPLPTLILANGLGVLGLTMATAPLAIVAGRTLAGTDAADIGALGTNVFGLQSVFLAIGLAVLAVAVVVRRHALASERRWAEQEFPLDE